MSTFEAIFLLVTALWVGEFLLFQNRGSSKTEYLDRQSFPLILMTVILAVALSLVMREWKIGIIPSETLWWFGLFLYTSGVALRYWGIIHLKEQFTRDVSVKKGDRLVSSGPYRKLRHPLYTGLFFIIVGFCLGVGNLWTAILCGGLLAAALLHRIRIEEAMLTQAHGEVYRSWCQTRYRLIPFVY